MLTLVALPLSCVAAHGRHAAMPIDSLIQVLDNTMAHREEYSNRRASEIEGFVRELQQAGTDSARFEVYGRLFDASQSYDADSAIAYALKRCELGARMKSPRHVAIGRLNLANVLALTGSYTEALETMRHIDKRVLEPDDRYLYYHVNRLLYGNMADYAVRQSDRERYTALVGMYRDSLLQIYSPDFYVWSLVKGDYYNAAGRYSDALRVMTSYIDNHNLDEHEAAIFAYTLSETYRHLGDRDNEKRYLLISAISDLRSGVREYVSPRKLAILLYDEGDIERAYQLMRVCLADATESSSRQRIFEINEVFPLVNEMYVATIQKQQRRLQYMIVVACVLLVFLVTALFSTYKSMRRARRATRSANEANESLRQANESLKDANHRLMQANAEIAEHSTVKNEYIGRYMEQCMQYIDAMSAHRKQLRKYLQAGNVDKVSRALDSDAVIDEQLRDFYADFDRTFLKLFPTFVRDFNDLLEPSGRTWPKADNTLNTELRIYALIRLGITDSAKIARFLRYSVTTIYNYRTKVRNRAMGDRSKLEEAVAAIGK